MKFDNKFYMILPSPKITIGLLLISIGIVVSFISKLIYLKIKRKKIFCIANKDTNLINKELSFLDQE